MSLLGGIKSNLELKAIDKGVKLSRKYSSEEVKAIDELCESLRKTANPPRCPEEAKEQAVTEGSTFLLKAIGDSAVGRAIKALKGKIS